MQYQLKFEVYLIRPRPIRIIVKRFDHDRSNHPNFENLSFLNGVEFYNSWQKVVQFLR